MSEQSPQPPQKLPGDGLLGWFGRQVAHIKNALNTDVSKSSKTIYRNSKTEEKPLPQNPNVKLRRTVIDEVVVNPDDPKSNPPKSP
jgi:hypothetical protein